MATQQVNYLINVTGNLQKKLDSATKGFDKLDKEVNQLKKNVGKASGKGGSGLAGSFAGLGGIIAGAFAVERVIAFGKASVEAFDKQAKAVAQVRQALISTGNTAGKTLDQLLKQASALQRKSLFGDEEILQGATAQLLTFTNIAGEQFDKTQQAVLDLSTRLGTDLKSSAIQLGKALNDPVANLSALSRSGIQFSDSQKATIKSLAETNRLADAQTIILNELEKQYGGSAEAAAKAGLGPFQQLQNAFGDFQEKVGEGLVDLGTKFIPAIEFLIANLDPLLELFKEMNRPIVQVFQEVSKLFPGFDSIGKSSNVLSGIFKVLNTQFRVMSSLFVFLVRRGIGFWEVISDITSAVMKFFGVSSGLPSIMDMYKKAFESFIFIWDNLPLILEAAWGAFKDFSGSLINLMINTGKSIFDILKASLDVKAIISGDTTGITSAVRDAVVQLQSDLDKVNLKKNFQNRLLAGLRKEEIAKEEEAATSLNASGANALNAAANAELTKVYDQVTGTRATNISLNIEKLIENLNFNTTNLSESTTKIKEEVTRVLIEALRDTTAIATN